MIAKKANKDLTYKVEFVDKVNSSLVRSFKNIANVSYEIYDEGNYEFLIVNYVGGAKAVRNCTGNSLSAILREFSRLVDGHYYEELDYYKLISSKYALV